MTDAATFAAVFAALFVAHSVGDHWVQTSWQAARKGDRNRTGHIACGLHVLSLTTIKAQFLLLTVVVLDLKVSVLGTALGLGLDAVSHYWADRRYTLAGLVRVCGKQEFHSIGTSDHPAHPVTADGEHAPTLGTGAYALDQSFHHFWLFVAALIIAAV
jgi:hypothetical protein